MKWNHVFFFVLGMAASTARYLSSPFPAGSENPDGALMALNAPRATVADAGVGWLPRTPPRPGAVRLAAHGGRRMKGMYAAPLSEAQYSEKFIAYLDVLGWKSLVRDSEERSQPSLQELFEILTALGTDADLKHFEEYGPTTCPEAPRIRKDMDFRITRASDCVLISAEVSPAGLINLVSHCYTACFKLLSKGVMCRGYIKRGPIYHTAEHQIGTGLNDVVAGETQVSIFKEDAEKGSTPFIEIDKEVVQYVEHQPDRCVKEIFPRLVKAEGDLAAIFPFQRLTAFDAGDPEKERASLNVIRDWIHKMKERVQHNIDPSDESVLRKGNHYIRLLDAQLVVCARREEMLDQLTQHYPSGRFTPEDFPGLF